jgi:hypothetical protein
MNIKSPVLILVFFIMNISLMNGQSVSFDIVTNPSIEFTFNSINKYQNGIIIPNAVTLNIVATGTNWDLYTGSTTSTAGVWDNVQYYSNVGDGFPSVGLLQVAFRNTSSTSQITGYVPMEDIGTTTLDVIGNHSSSPDPTVNCSDVVHQGTNSPGTYVTDPQCYTFKVDFKIVPGLTYRAGVYNLRVDIILAPDL